MAARPSASTTCEQIGLAIVNYETRTRSFPPGAIYYNSGDGGSNSCSGIHSARDFGRVCHDAGADGSAQRL